MPREMAQSFTLGLRQPLDGQRYPEVKSGVASQLTIRDIAKPDEEHQIISGEEPSQVKLDNAPARLPNLSSLNTTSLTPSWRSEKPALPMSASSSRLAHSIRRGSNLTAGSLDDDDDDDDGSLSPLGRSFDCLDPSLLPSVGDLHRGGPTPPLTLVQQQGPSSDMRTTPFSASRPIYFDSSPSAFGSIGAAIDPLMDPSRAQACLQGHPPYGAMPPSSDDVFAFDHESILPKENDTGVMAEVGPPFGPKAISRERSLTAARGSLMVSEPLNHNPLDIQLQQFPQWRLERKGVSGQAATGDWQTVSAAGYTTVSIPAAFKRQHSVEEAVAVAAAVTGPPGILLGQKGPLDPVVFAAAGVTRKPDLVTGDSGRVGGVRWHEVVARVVPNPFRSAVATGDGGQALLLVQTDMTERVTMELSLATLSEGQLSLLSSIFPRHVVEHLSMNGDMSRLPEHFGGLARTHDNVTLLFLDIVGFTEMSKQVHAGDILIFLNQ